MLENIKLSVVFPIYNEEKNIINLLTEWDSVLKEKKITYEFVIAEDGSNDKTKDIIKDLKKNIILTINQLQIGQVMGQQL